MTFMPTANIQRLSWNMLEKSETTYNLTSFVLMSPYKGLCAGPTSLPPTSLCRRSRRRCWFLATIHRITGAEVTCEDLRSVPLAPGLEELPCTFWRTQDSDVTIVIIQNHIHFTQDCCSTMNPIPFQIDSPRLLKRFW